MKKVVLSLAFVALAGALIVSYSIETFNQVIGCEVHDPLLGFYKHVEGYINIQPFLNNYALSFFEGARGQVKLFSLNLAFCQK